MKFFQTAIYTGLVLASSNAYSPTSTSYTRPEPKTVSGPVYGELKRFIPGHGFYVAHKDGNYFFYCMGKEGDKLDEFVTARNGIEVRIPDTPRLFERIVPITIEDIITTRKKN